MVDFKEVKIEEVAYLINICECLDNIDRDVYRATLRENTKARNDYILTIFTKLILKEIKYLKIMIEDLRKLKTENDFIVYEQIFNSYFDNKILLEEMNSSSEIFNLKPYLNI
ncbi:MAG: hypothetical protein Q9M91_02195 [Candidatus Dojkabacteria bacterium]|nr:hypothetical protein [Candidatus Dojkabacteria bacterium]MDQ7020635.1 hypothetical protein [Candidatus Dojkabacteria bacterium]